MAASIAIILVLGLGANALFNKIKLPGLLGMMILGMIIGPYALAWVDPELLEISSEFRKIALIIILLRSGLGISRKALNSVGKTVVKISFIPELLEGLVIAFAAVKIFGFSFIEGSILGFIIAPVSLAIVVPQTLHFLDRGIGIRKNIPTILLAGSSLDNIFAITFFSLFLGLYSGKQMNIGIELLHVPVSIILGISLGLVIGVALVKIFHKYHIRDTKKVLLIIGAAIFITMLEDALKNCIEIAGLIGVIAIGFVILEKKSEVANRLAAKFNKVWIFAEILLFVLIGAQVDISLVLSIGLKGILIIFTGLIARGIGVILSVQGIELAFKEKLFCVVSFIPKATVQAAIGAVPLTAGIPSGEIILAVAVLSILITAPIGAIGIKNFADSLLTEKKR